MQTSAPVPAANALRRYELLSENARDVVLFVRPDGQILEANRAAAEAYGYTRQELLLMKVHDLRAEETRGTVPGEMLTAGATGITFETIHRRKDGTCFPVEVSSSTSPIGGGILLSLVRDITRRKQAEQTQQLLRDVDRQILQGEPLAVILQTICGRLTGLFGYKLVWIATKAPDGSVGVLAAAGESTGFLDSLVVRWDETDLGRGPTGTAIRTGAPQIIPTPDPGWDAFRERAERFELRSSLSLPLNARGQTLGALSMYGAREDTFDAETAAMLSRFADQVAMSILASRDQEQIRLQTAALEATASSVVITDRTGRIQWVNQAFTELTGYTAAEALGQTTQVLKSGNQSHHFYRQMWETILAGQTWRGELYNRRKDGTLYAEEMTITPVRNPAGETTHFVAVKQDISERKQQEDRLRHLATHDPVTDLFNRRALEDTLRRSVRRAARGEHSALLLLDMDHFKQVNDACGHAAGDRLLVSLATRLRNAVRPFDLLARWGGDEFAVLLEDCTLGEALGVAERLRTAVAHLRAELLEASHPLDVSIGLAPVDGSLNAEAVMALADWALYKAKADGGGRAVVGDPAGAGLLHGDSASPSRLQEALARQRLVLHYQPVVRLATGEVDRYEALVRLRESGDNVVMPGSFLPEAQRTGAMPALELWVLDRVLERLVKNPRLQVSVNLSGIPLDDDRLLDALEASIRAAGDAAGRLAFELSESAAAQDLASAQRLVWRLKSLGCRFALDGFGTGLASYGYMKDLPVDCVKIAGQYMRHVDTDPVARAMVEAVTGVAHALGREVVAQWVESETVADVLRQIGVDLAQGYHFGGPAPEL